MSDGSDWPRRAASTWRRGSGRRPARTKPAQDLPDDAYRADLSRTEAIEAMLFIGASQPYHELVEVAGSTPDRYATWLADALWQLFFAPD